MNWDNLVFQVLLDFPSLEEWHVLLQVERHRVVYDALDEVNESGDVPKSGGEWFNVTPEHSSPMRWQQPFIFSADEADVDLLIHSLKCDRC